MLEVRFTEVTLMHLLGVEPQKSILRRHVSTKFQDLIGPLTAQRKLDAFASKASPPLDPFEKAKVSTGHRVGLDVGGDGRWGWMWVEMGGGVVGWWCHVSCCFVQKKPHKPRPKGLMDGTPLCPAHTGPSPKHPARDVSFSGVDPGSHADPSLPSDTR